MTLKDRMIVEDFRSERGNFEQLEGIVVGILEKTIKEGNVLTTGVEHRIKDEKSLEIKLHKKGENYHTMLDVTDLLGVRVICYFADDVYKLGKLVEQVFEVDWENSVDKSKMMDADSFGYLSLHYICSLKAEEGYPESLTEKRFEIQIRSILQHAWSVIQHDLGYKTAFGVPREVVREFARLAGLLEIADSEFARARDHINAYTEEIREKISNDNADDVNVDVISLREYMLRNKKMRAFLEELATIENSEIAETDPDNYIKRLRFLKVDTIGKLQAMLARNADVALKLAQRTLAGSELDILASNVALRFLCQAELLTGGYTEAQAVEFMRLSSRGKHRAEGQAKRLFQAKEELNLV